MIYTVINIATVICEIIIIFMFFDSVLSEPKGGPLLRVVIGLAFSVLTFLYNSFISNHVASFVIMILLTFMCSAAYKDSVLKKFLMSLMYMIFMAMANFIYILVLMPFGVSIDELMNDKSVYNNAGLVIVMTVLIIFVKTAGLFFGKTKAKVYLNYWIPLLTIPIVNIVFILHYTNYLRGLNAEGSYSLFILLITLLYSTILVFYLFDKLTSLLDERRILSEQVGAQKNRPADAGAEDEKFLSLRHDIKNHLFVVRSLIRGGKYDDADAYISELEPENRGELDDIIDTGNPAADILISGKKAAAERLGTEFSVKTAIPENLKISAADMVILLGNLLDNAIEGCERADAEHKSISLEIRYRPEYLLCVTENTSGYVKIENGNIKSSKTDGGTHGIGQKNIKRIVDKYNGEITQKYENGRFVVKLVLFIE